MFAWKQVTGVEGKQWGRGEGGIDLGTSGVGWGGEGARARLGYMRVQIIGRCFTFLGGIIENRSAGVINRSRGSWTALCFPMMSARKITSNRKGKSVSESGRWKSRR